jgi:hypothetical protein
VSKQVSIPEFFKNIELPNGSWLTCEGNAEPLSYDLTGFYLVDSLGRYGYNAHFSGAYVCYTCGHLCECGEE